MEALLSKLKREREEAHHTLLTCRVSMEDCSYCAAYTTTEEPDVKTGLKHHHGVHSREIRRATELVKGYDIVIKALDQHIEVNV